MFHHSSCLVPNCRIHSQNFGLSFSFIHQKCNIYNSLCRFFGAFWFKISFTKSIMIENWAFNISQTEQKLKHWNKIIIIIRESSAKIEVDAIKQLNRGPTFVTTTTKLIHIRCTITFSQIINNGLEWEMSAQTDQLIKDKMCPMSTNNKY